MAIPTPIHISTIQAIKSASANKRETPFGLTFGLGFLFSTALTISSGAAAQAPQALLDGLSTCRAIQSVAMRIDCFDTLAEQAAINIPAETSVIAPSSAAVVPSRVVPSRVQTEVVLPSTNNIQNGVDAQAPTIAEVTQATPIEATESTTEADFGLINQEQIEEKLSQELFSSIASLNEVRPRKWQISLANGQVWRQKDVALYRLRVEDEVRIYLSGWGDNSFRLSSTRLRGFIPVERVR